MVSANFLEYSRRFGLDEDTPVEENGSHPVAQLPPGDLGEPEVLEQVRVIMAHGYDRLEVLIRQGQITTINSQTTLDRAGKQ